MSVAVTHGLSLREEEVKSRSLREQGQCFPQEASRISNVKRISGTCNEICKGTHICANNTNEQSGDISKVKQSRYRPGVAQRVPGS